MKYTFHIVDVFSSTPFAVINSIEPRRQLWNVMECWFRMRSPGRLPRYLMPSSARPQDAPWRLQESNEPFYTRSIS